MKKVFLTDLTEKNECYLSEFISIFAAFNKGYVLLKNIAASNYCKILISMAQNRLNSFFNCFCTVTN